MSLTVTQVIVIREAKRTNPVYRPHALKSLGEFAKIREDLDMMPDGLKIVSQVVDELSSNSENKMEVDSGGPLARK